MALRLSDLRAQQYSNSDVPLWQPDASHLDNYTPNQLNQYDVINAISYQNDDNGDLTSDGINSYSYDTENRLIGANTPLHNTHYQYDPMGRRAEKTVDGNLTEFFYDGGDVLVEYDNLGNIKTRYIHGAGVDQPILMEKNGNRYYYHTDHLGSVIALSDGNTGAVVEQYAYGPYGESHDTSSVGNPYRYTGRRLDQETGLYYYRARYYSTALGRFLQPDPIGYGMG